MPTPTKGEGQQKYISRCIPIRQKEHKGEDVKQSTAICYSMYREWLKKLSGKSHGK